MSVTKNPLLSNLSSCEFHTMPLKTNNFNRMKNLLTLALFLLFLAGCSGLEKMTNKAFYYAAVGQTEKEVYSRVGTPSRIETTTEGEKILVYEVPSKGMFKYPNKSQLSVKADPKLNGQKYSWSVNPSVNTTTNAAEYQDYATNMTFLKIYLDKDGVCTRVEQNLQDPQLEFYYDRLKKYIPEE